MLVMLGEMKKLFEHEEGVVEDDSYIKAMAKVEQGIKRLTNQATSKQCCNLVEDGDALEQPRLEVEDRGKMVASQEAGTRKRFQRMVVQRVNQAIRLGAGRSTSSWRS